MACSKTQSTFEARAIEPPSSHHEVYRGSLYQAHREIQESPFREKCDQRTQEIQATLVTVLDSKKEELLNIPVAKSEIGETRIPFNGSFLVQKEKTTAASSEWKERSYSWKRVYEFYLAHYKTGNTLFWSTLNAYVRSLITDDRKRVINGFNLYLTHDHVEALPSLVETISTCELNPYCRSIEWNAAQKKVISEVPAYAHFQKELEKAYFNRDKRAVITKFHERLLADDTYHQVYFNPGVSHRMIEGVHHYQIAMDGSDFNEHEREILKNAIESVWKNETNEINLQWKMPNLHHDLFKVLFFMEPGNRAVVNFEKREMQLSPFTALRTIAHEFGHVLGFDDHYYTIWDPERCEYRDQSNAEDLMSVSESGEVTEAEWKTLFDQYKNR